MRRIRLFPLWIAAFACSLPAVGQDSQPAIRDVDACGTVVRGATCFLVEVGGGRYFVADFFGFREGDAVRVVGTIDETCVTICGDADGCIRGAVLYDSTVFPCGTDIVTPFDPCAGLSSALLASLFIGLVCANRR